MKKILLAGVAITALAVAAPANAADLRMPVKAAPIAAPAPAYTSWTGCHVGAHVGWGWGKKDTHEARLESGGGFSSRTQSASKIDTSGGIFGGQVGCDIGLGQLVGPQWSNWVLGVEGSLAGTDINGFASDATNGFDQFSMLSVKMDWLGSVTGRLGFSGWLPNTLLYVRGGWAWAQDRWNISQAQFYFATATATQTVDGWTIGVGAEWAFAPSWSAFIEWDHYDFGTNRVISRTSSGGDTNVLDASQTIETVKIGVNYRFNIGALGFGKGVTARY